MHTRISRVSRCASIASYVTENRAFLPGIPEILYAGDPPYLIFCNAIPTYMIVWGEDEVVNVF